MTPNEQPDEFQQRPRYHLQAEQIAMIEEALCSVGDFGEVRLVMEKGRMRYLVVSKSMDALRLLRDQEIKQHLDRV